jgi:hypothetical protein
MPPPAAPPAAAAAVQEEGRMSVSGHLETAGLNITNYSKAIAQSRTSSSCGLSWNADDNKLYQGATGTGRRQDEGCLRSCRYYTTQHCTHSIILGTPGGPE